MPEDLLGHGVSAVPVLQQMRPLKVCLLQNPLVGQLIQWGPKVPKPRAEKECPGILSPDDPRLRLTAYDRNPAILDRCGRHVFLFTDPETDSTVSPCVYTFLVSQISTQVDFWAYGAFSDEVLKQLCLHFEEQVDGVRTLRRGGKFDFFSAGTMRPHGTRMPMGGGKADGYTMYSGMGAGDPASINLLFNHAEVLLVSFVCLSRLDTYYFLGP